MTYKTILTQQDEEALVITLNRPEKRNAFSVQLMGELIDAVTAADADPSVRAVIITGGTSFFGAGADLNEPLAIKHVASEGVQYFKRWHKLCSTMEELGKPVIAAIEGFCITGALEFVLACDIRIAAEGASFAITSSKIGTVAGAGGTQRLPRIVGINHALDIMMLAEPFDAQEAYRMGMIKRVVPKGEALKAAKAVVKILAQRAPLSLAFVKRVVYRGMQMDLASAVEFETFLVSTIYTSEDRKEGISAFLEKRDAKFKGK